MLPPFIEKALNVTDAPAQTGLAVGETVIPTGRFGLTVMIIELDMAGFPVAQVASEISSHVILSPFIGVQVYVIPVAPDMDVPLTFHWYPDPEPPFTVEDVKDTIVPEHTVIAEAEIDMETGRFGLTVMINVFEVAGLPVAQVASEVSTQVTSSPSTGI